MTDDEQQASPDATPSTELDDTALDQAGQDDEAPGASPDAAVDAAAGLRPPTLLELPNVLEALLFVSDGPVDEATLARLLGVRRREVDRALSRLGERLQAGGLRLQVGPDGAQLVTAPSAARYVELYLGLEGARRLSNAALETLAVIAYRQPVTRAQVEAIRGVNSDAPLATLKTRGLITESGRAEGPGRPALFSTTQRFLEHFGLERPEDLPPLPTELTAGIEAVSGRQLALSDIAPGSGSTGDAQDAANADTPARRATDAPDAASPTDIAVATQRALATRPAMALAAVAQRALSRRPSSLPATTGPAARPAVMPGREARLPTMHTGLPGGPPAAP